MPRNIKKIELDLSRGKIISSDLEVQELPKVVDPLQKVGRKYEYRTGEKGGKTTGMTNGQYLEHLFIYNEKLHILKHPLQNIELEHNFMIEFPHSRMKRRFHNRSVTIGMKRTEYNKRKLYAGQPHPSIVSFRYGADGYIIQSTSAGRYASFEECLARCVEYSIIDPRFYTWEQILELHTRQQAGDSQYKHVVIPSLQALHELKKFLGVDRLYDCIKFPEGYR